MAIGTLQTSAFREFVHGFSDGPYTLRDNESNSSLLLQTQEVRDKEDSGLLAVSNFFFIYVPFELCLERRVYISGAKIRSGSTGAGPSGKARIKSTTQYLSLM